MMSTNNTKDMIWFRGWFDSPYYPILYSHRDNNEAAVFLDSLFDAIGINKSMNILDIGCGRGRHAIYLNSKGHRVTGIDVSEESIVFASRHTNESLHFKVHDMRNLFTEDSFDLALNMFSSFGYFASDADNLSVISNSASALRSGGQFILDFLNAEYVANNLVRKDTIQVSDVTFNIQRTIEQDRIIKHIEVRDKGETFSYAEKIKAYGKKELDEFFRSADLVVEKTFGNYNLEPFDETVSPRLILIGRKN